MGVNLQTQKRPLSRDRERVPHKRAGRVSNGARFVRTQTVTY